MFIKTHIDGLLKSADHTARLADDLIMGAGVIGIGAEIAVTLMGAADQRCIAGQVDQDIAFGFNAISKRVEAPAITGLRPGFGKAVDDHLEFGETAADSTDFPGGNDTCQLR